MLLLCKRIKFLISIINSDKCAFCKFREKIIKVEIISTLSDGMWYKYLINHRFDVVDYDDVRYQVDDYHYIYKSDCIILK